ncbi:MAG TPA: YHS domain-containing protein, partial [Candidatus Limnocylindria bacterium]|nr:YHS domain-containing protein [Candidatus Limnocylindria bacterium]
MRGFVTALIVGSLWAAGLAAPRYTAAAETAICLVCQVMEGEVAAEEVKASRTHEGKTYGFCSEKCAQAFVADPIAYLPPA